MKYAKAISALSILTLIIFVGCQQGDEGGEGPWEIQQLTSFGEYPVYSPDGDMVAFGGEDNGTFGIWVHEFGVGREILVEMAHNWDYAWSPGSDRIAFSNSSGGNDRGIWITDLQGNLTHLYNDGRYPCWSPSGDTIVFQDGVGSGIYWIADTGGVAQPLVPIGQMPRWSPQGGYIAFYEISAPEYYLYLYNISSGSYSYLIAGGPNFDWSPDGASIVYERYEMVSASGYNFNVKVTSISNPGSSVLWPSAQYPRWSPNGTRIAFEALSGDVGDGIFVIQPAGGTAEEVSPYGDQPSFNPTGNKIVFRKMSGVWLATRS